MRRAILLTLLLMSWTSAASAQKKKLLDEPIDRPTNHVNFWCPSSAYMAGSFVADGTEVTLSFRAQIHETFDPDQFMDQRIDNVTLVTRSVYDAHVSAANTDSFFCLPDPPNVFFFNDVPAQDIVFQDTFASGPNPGWDTSHGAFYVSAATSTPDKEPFSAPNDLRGPSNESGGSLGLGAETDTQQFATTSIVVQGLVPGVEYVLDFWWKSGLDDSVGGGEVRNGDLFVEVLGAEPLPVSFDVRPGRCPNSLNVKSHEPIPAAILGTANLDVADIDVSSLRVLGSIVPVRSGVGDVGSPPAAATACACPGGRDGIPDLTLRFNTSDIVAHLGQVADGDSREILLTGNLLDGTPLQGTDCIAIRVPGPSLQSSAGLPLLLGVGPLLPGRVRSIQYALPEAAPVRLMVYDAAGRVVARLLDGMQPAGVHEVSWDTGSVASGIYFMRLESAGSTSIAKTVVVR